MWAHVWYVWGMITDMPDSDFIYVHEGSSTSIVSEQVVESIVPGFYVWDAADQGYYRANNDGDGEFYFDAKTLVSIEWSPVKVVVEEH